MVAGGERTLQKGKVTAIWDTAGHVDFHLQICRCSFKQPHRVAPIPGGKSKTSPCLALHSCCLLVA